MSLNKNLYTVNILNDIIVIDGDEISNSIDEILTKKLKDKVGHRCIKEGYVDKESIKIIERTIGKIVSHSFDGSIKYNIKYSADVCNLLKGLVVTGKIKNISKMGILLDKQPLEIILARQHHADKSIFDNSNYDDEINVTILGSKFDLNDDKIICIGKLN